MHSIENNEEFDIFYSHKNTQMSTPINKCMQYMCLTDKLTTNTLIWSSLIVIEVYTQNEVMVTFAVYLL